MLSAFIIAYNVYMREKQTGGDRSVR